MTLAQVVILLGVTNRGAPETGAPQQEMGSIDDLIAMATLARQSRG